MEKYTKNAKKEYKPRPKTEQGNVDSWEIISKALKSGPKTREQLEAKLVARNHTGFVKYAIRREWLVAK